MENICGLSDRDLLDRCEHYGREALKWRNMFRAMLPEVARRKLYLRKGYSSVYVFGKILAGLSEEQVSESLNIVARLKDKPALRQLLESGEVSVNKITKVMSIATSDNESELAEKVQMLSVRALETFVRDVKQEICQELSEAESLHVQKPECNSLFSQDQEGLGLSETVINKLRELKRCGVDINAALMEFLQEREEKLQQKKDEIAESLPEESSRYVPRRVKDVVRQEYGDKCAKYGCNKPSQELHHTARYSITRSHDPNYLAPLCQNHHEIAHKMDVKMTECSRVPTERVRR